MFCKNCGSQVPEGVTFCAACGTPVVAANAAPAAAAAPAAGFKLDKSLLIKVVAGVAALALLILLFAAVFGGGAKSVAKKYVKAEIEGDMKKGFSVMAGKYQKYFEEVVYGDDDYRDEEFEWLEDACDEEDIEVKIEKFGQYYKAYKKWTKVENKDYYGKNYKVKIEVRDVVDMKDKVVKAYQEVVDDDTCEEYIKAKKIKKGKFVVVKVIIDGSEETETRDVVVPVVKYGGSWKVLNAYSYIDDEDYEYDEDKYEAFSTISKAASKAAGEDDEDDYSSDYDYDYYYDEEDYDYDY